MELLTLKIIPKSAFVTIPKGDTIFGQILSYLFLKNDTTFKNYLNEEHINQLDRIVVAYLELAQLRAERGIVMNMKDWIKFLDRFIELSDYPILIDNGKVSALEAKLKAQSEYEQYRVIQDREYLSDFDTLLLDNKKADD